MRFYEIEDQIVCADCREESLRLFGPGTEANDDEKVTPRMFRALGEHPWAPAGLGERYMQCDGCNGQWGPDA